MKLFYVVIILLSCDHVLNEPFVSNNPIITHIQWPKATGKFPYHVQSPTDIDITRARAILLSQITIHLFWSMPDEVVCIENTGYYLEVLLCEDVPERPYVTGGPLFGDNYLLEQMHFHWGKDDGCGSEHRINGKCFACEVHVVTYNSKYGSYDKAKYHPDGIAVIAFFGETTNEHNSSFDALVKRIPEIIQPESETKGSFHEEFQFLEILFQQKTYYSIPGSLTTPPFLETVCWIMYPTPFKISHEQLAAFRTLKSKDGGTMITQNDRELQDFGPRPVITPIINGKPHCEDN